MKSTPSLLYCTLNLATMTFIAALEAAYKEPISISKLLVKSMSARPVEMVMTFLTLPFKTRGTKRWNRCTLPMTLVCHSCEETISSSSTLLLLVNTYGQPQTRQYLVGSRPTMRQWVQSRRSRTRRLRWQPGSRYHARQQSQQCRQRLALS